MAKYIKGCEWYKGKHATPDLSKCKKCLYKIECVGRNYMKWKKLIEVSGMQSEMGVEHCSIAHGKQSATRSPLNRSFKYATKPEPRTKSMVS